MTVPDPPTFEITHLNVEAITGLCGICKSNDTTPPGPAGPVAEHPVSGGGRGMVALAEEVLALDRLLTSPVDWTRWTTMAARRRPSTRRHPSTRPYRHPSTRGYRHPSPNPRRSHLSTNRS